MSGPRIDAAVLRGFLFALPLSVLLWVLIIAAVWIAL